MTQIFIIAEVVEWTLCQMQPPHFTPQYGAHKKRTKIIRKALFISSVQLDIKFQIKHANHLLWLLNNSHNK